MYTEFFRLNEPPFSLTPDPRYLFMSARHREGLAHLVYGVQQPGGFVQLTGEVGTGKTTLCRCLIKQLPPDTDVALIINPRLTATELLETVCDELAIPRPAVTGSVKALTDALNQHLLESHAQHRRTVLIIDEAQNLHADVLEQIRLLTNLETSREKLLQIILIGQPELLSILKRRGLRQLAQRVTARYHLQALSRHETCAYIKHRLAVAGKRDPVFTTQAMRQVYRMSVGMPRLINIICDRAMLGAYALGKTQVSAAIVLRAAQETQGIVPWYRKMRPGWLAGILTLAAMIAGIALFLASANLSGLRRNTASETALADNNRPAAIPAETVRPAAALEIAQSEVVAPPPGTEPSAAPAGPTLADILSDPSLRGNGITSFTSLYARWGESVSMGPSDYGCRMARDQGFECLFQRGKWMKLRRFDLPVILEIKLPDGNPHRVTLIELGENTATLAIGKREYVFPLTEIDRVWSGSFILLWKPPPFAARELHPGTQGDEVAWVRRALDRAEGKNAVSAVSEAYDEDLERRVSEFQRERSLTPNGSVGIETLVQLALAVTEPEAPSITRDSF